MRQSQLLMGIALCAVALLAFTGCPDGSDPSGDPGGPTATDDTTSPVIPLTEEATLDSDGNGFININTIDDMNTIRNSLAGNQVQCGTDGTTACMGYELLRDLDFANPAHYDSGTINPAWRPNNPDPDRATNPGWDPIGKIGVLTAFSARLNGNGNTISNLYVRRSGRVGLFGRSGGIIDGIGIVNARLYGEGGSDTIGGLVGRIISGTVIDSYTTGVSINGGGGSDTIGGLVGANFGATITTSYATGGSIDGGGGGDTIGGLVGHNFAGTVTASYATGGSINAEAENNTIGGLIGQNQSGTVTASYATRDVSGAGSADRVGSLIGFSFGTITASYGFGTEMGGENAGVTRSDDASLPATVVNACALTPENSSTMTGMAGMPDNRWDAAQWDFGTATERPVVRNSTGVIVPGQTDRGCI